MGRGSKPGERRGGRQTGAPNRINAATRDRILTDADPIAFLASIMNGNTIKARPPGGETEQDLIPTIDQRLSAARELARIACPTAKDRAVALDLPRVETAEDVAKAMGIIIEAMGQGAITPSEADAIAGVLEHRRKAIETDDLSRRMEAIEAGMRGPA